MRMMVYGHREDETALFEECNRRYHYDVAYTAAQLTAENCGTAAGYDAVCIVVGSRITEAVAQGLKNLGVRYILTRAAGTDHLDLDAIARHGLKASNVPAYSPNSVSEHTVLLLLACVRRLREQLRRVDGRNFVIAGLRGRELRTMTVGVIGAGKIGCATLRNLSGFGCRLLVHSPHEKEELSGIANFVSKAALLAMSDAVILHCPLTPGSTHLIDREAVDAMKPGVCLVNTARGGLVDTRAVLEGLTSGKIGSFGFDVYERESAFCRKDLKGAPVADDEMEELLAQPDAIYTTHTAFYTDEAVSNMIGTSFENLYEYETSGACRNEVRR